MKRICAWCGKDLGGTGETITHTICADCSERLEREAQKLRLLHTKPACQRGL